MRKKVLSLLLPLMVCLGLLPAPAAALSDGTFEYSLFKDEITIDGVIDQTVENLVIPASIAGKPVTKIGHSAFDTSDLNDNLKSVVLPNTITEIEDFAFCDCEQLTSINLPNGLKTIGTSAFSGCGFQSLVLPESVSKIEEGAFGNNHNLTNIILPSGLTEIPGTMLSFCSSLTEVKIPPAVKKIGSSAFSNTGIVRITIPQGVTVIPHQAFSECKDLKEIDLPAGLTEIKSSAFWGCTSLKQLLLPTSLTEIGGNAFNKSGVEELILPYGVTDVMHTSFRECSSLARLYVPSTLEWLGGYFPDNCLVYCMPESDVEKKLEENGFISYTTDASCDTRINVLYNGRRVSFGAYGQNPTAVNNRTMVPLRSIFEAMGAEVQWEQATQTVTAIRGSTKIVMTLGQNSYTVNGESKTMDTPPMALNSRTMVPVRVVAESFGADVAWHAASATVLITE